MSLIAKHITIEGLVQGVGFRPFIYRMAHTHGIKGWVLNTNKNVEIHAEAQADKLSLFIDSIRNNKPQASKINNIETAEAELKSFTKFSIRESAERGNEVTQVSPDICVCPDCLHDMETQDNRINYPLINCTNCGPRFTIVESLPYDRANTTMHEFEMCTSCKAEYENVLDRRFHAQPIACEKCGPHFTLHTKNETIESIDEILGKAAELVDNGKIIAMKGIGGYHLCCDALNETAVSKLRIFKNREQKPLAVMVKDLEVAQKHAELTFEEEKLISSWQRPIVICKSKNILPLNICGGLSTLGLVLPYAPFHFLLFEHLDTNTIVLTSGNISDEPILIDDQQAIETFLPELDAVITYNRKIHNRTDDSLVQQSGDYHQILRRSRSYAPSPIKLQHNCEGILAAGAELVNCFAIGKGNQALLSQYIGDLQNAETFDFYLESLERYQKLFNFTPNLIVHDLHPDYLSTSHAQQYNLSKIAVQHHHAHIAAVMAEHGLKNKVIGLSFDGTGYGSDEHIWGGEFMIADYAGFERIQHFPYMEIPGGDKAVKEPWTIALSALFELYGENTFNSDLPFIQNITSKYQQKVEILRQTFGKNLHPLSSSMGRIFDAVAALTGVCTHSGFHAQAPMLLQDIADTSTSEHYNYNIHPHIELSTMFREIVQDISKGTSNSIIAAKFHNTIIHISVDLIKSISKNTGIKDVVLSGGSFQNFILLNGISNKLSSSFNIYTGNSIPVNDGGIALGQIAIAAHKLEMGYVK
jgi:hydrogenase maturation protein HypF